VWGLRFVTNTTSRSRAQTLAKLARLGFEVDSAEHVTPARLAVSHCLKHDRRRVLLVMNDEVKEDFAELVEDDGAHAEAVIVTTSVRHSDTTSSTGRSGRWSRAPSSSRCRRAATGCAPTA
jgi:ribonucleotide monophosphatase NagD (HAD superfamily)